MLLTAVLFLAQSAHLPGPRGWSDVVLPHGFQLVPGTAEVTNSAAERSEAWFTYEAGVLACRGTGMSLYPLEGAERHAGPFHLPEEGEAPGAGQQLAPQVDDAYIYRTQGGVFGYLRVLDLAPDRLRLEHALGNADGRALVREPGAIRATTESGAVRLKWEAVLGARYRIERRYRDAAGERVQTFEVDGSEFLDAAPELEGQLVEYSVARAREHGTEFGARVRAASHFWESDPPLVLRRGQFVNLISGETRLSLADFKVETVSSNGVQLAVENGARLWALAGGVTGSWVLPAGPSKSYQSPRLYLQAGREAVAISRDGLYARLSVEVGDDGAVALRRELDLRGGRFLPRAPTLASWSYEPPGALRFEFVALMREIADAENGTELTPVVELESPFESGRWVPVASGVRGSGEALVETSGEVRTERYRFRYRLHQLVVSSPSEPVVAIVGDDHGPAVEAGLASALLDLTSVEFERRRKAHRLIKALGSRAWPALRDALASDSPELASASAELLAETGAESDEVLDSGPELPFALRIASIAERHGVEGPIPGSLTDDPIERATALMRQSEDESFAPWVAVLADGDPDLGVRRLALSLLEGREDSWLERAFWRFEDEPESADLERLPIELQLDEWSRFFADRPSVLGCIRVVTEALDLDRPRASQALLLSLWDLTLAQGSSREGQAGAMSRARLALLLQAQYSLQDEPLFLEAAGRLGPVGDEQSAAALRMRALRDLVHLWGAHNGSVGATEIELAEPSLTALKTELQILAEDPPPAGVILRLPEGRYTSPSGAITSLSLDVPGLHLIGEGECVFDVPLRASDVRGVLLENIVVRTDTATAFSLYRASARAIDCEFSSSNTVLQVNEATFFASGCLVSSLGSRPATYGVRATGSSLLLMDETVVRGCATGVSITGTAYLERCVVMGGARSAIECPTGGGELMLLDVYVAASGAAFGRLNRAGIDGLIVAAASSVNLTRGVIVCPERFHVLASLQREPSGFTAHCLID